MASYQSLARKYRPKSFHELSGQHHISTALQNAIELGRQPCAVLFSGIRGVGKTTSARLYAKALVCESATGASSCGVCEHCIDIEKSGHADVLEIDGASHNGVEEVRQLQELAGYQPVSAQYRIFIIDEVHMLSVSAFNALLKLLEEPPARVIFIFATTELHKVPQTILSRCQTYHLRKLSVAEIVARIEYVLGQERVEASPVSIQRIACLGAGSMRDAMTCLDQCLALGGGKITEDVLDQSGLWFDASGLLNLLQALIERDLEACLEAVARYAERGTRFDKLCASLIACLRNAMITASVKDVARYLPTLSDYEREQLGLWAKQVAKTDLSRLFRTFMQCYEDLTGSELDRYILENTLTEWCVDTFTLDLEAFSRDLVAAKKTSEGTQLEVSTQVPVRKNIPESATVIEPRVQPKPEPSQQAPVESLGFPDDWEGLVAAYRQKKPLRARHWEEAKLSKYSAERIEFWADSESPLTQRDLQAELVGFIEKTWSVKTTLQLGRETAQEKKEDEPQKTASILEQKAHQAQLKQQAALKAAAESSAVKEMKRQFKIEPSSISYDPIGS